MQDLKAKTLAELRKHHLEKNSQALLNQAARLQSWSPNSIIGRVYTARALAMQKNFVQAAEILDTIVIPFPKLKKIYLEYLNMLWEAGRKSQWEVQAQRFLTFHENPPLRLKLARHFCISGQWRFALHQLRKAIECEPSLKSKIEPALAQVYFQLGDYKSARPLLEKVQGSKPMFMLARIYEDQGSYGLAYQALLKIPEAEHSLKIQNSLARLCRLMQNSEGEGLALNRMLEFKLSDSVRMKILDRLGTLGQKIGDSVMVLKALKMQMRLSPGSSALVEKAGQIYMHLGQAEKALPFFQKLHKERPFARSYLLQVIEAAQASKNEAVAYKALKAGLLCGLNDAGLNLQLARLSFKNKKFVECRELLQKLQADGESRAEVYWLMKCIYKAEGNLRAEQYYARLYEQIKAA